MKCWRREFWSTPSSISRRAWCSSPCRNRWRSAACPEAPGAATVRSIQNSSLAKTLPISFECVRLAACLSRANSRGVAHETPSGAFAPSVEFALLPTERSAAVILLHNHPSGCPEPSQEDRDCTRRLCEAGKILGIRVLDHVVIGQEAFFSFADCGLLAV